MRDILNVKFTDDIKIISIVRNPYNRIVSDLFYFKLIQKTSSQEDVYNMIKHFINNNYDNHNLPQYLFLIDDNGELINNVSIFRTETLTEDMIKYGYDDFNVHANVNSIECSYDDYLNNDSIRLINEIYEKDFLYFSYDIKK
jgi:hypothetical protein